jgi:hypothetical protein
MSKSSEEAKAAYLEHGIQGKPSERDKLIKERNKIVKTLDNYKKEAVKRDAREAAAKAAAKPPMKRGGKVKRARKSKPAVSQKQSVNVNVKNIVQMLKERKQPNMIQVQRYVPHRNLMMGSRTLMASPPTQYGNTMPVFLPVQERRAVYAPQDHVVSNPVLPNRPDPLFVETNPHDIEPSRPSLRAVPYDYTPITTRSNSPELRPFEEAGHPQHYTERYRPQPQPIGIGHPPRLMTPTMLDDSEDLVARASDQDSRDQYEAEKALRRSLGAKRAWDTRRQRAAVPIGVPMAPASSSASASAQPGYATPSMLEPED